MLDSASLDPRNPRLHFLVVSGGACQARRVHFLAAPSVGQREETRNRIAPVSHSEGRDPHDFIKAYSPPQALRQGIPLIPHGDIGVLCRHHYVLKLTTHLLNGVTNVSKIAIYEFWINVL